MKQKKQMLAILIVLLIMFNSSMCFAYWATYIESANGSSSTTLSIGDWIVVPPGSIVVTEEVLVDLLMGELPLDGDYVLTGDVDLTDYAENDFEPITNFSGSFEGNGFSIGGFEIVNTNADPNVEIGIFLNVGTEGEISNINISDVTVVQNDGSAGNNTNETSYVGVLVGNNEGTISNVQIIGSSITGGNQVSSGVFGSSTTKLYAGGLVGRNSGSIRNSYARVNVTLNSSLSTSFLGNSTGDIYVGGLVGFNEGEISQSYATGNVSSIVDTSAGFLSSTSVNTYTGGLVGYNANGGYVHHVFSTGSIHVSVDTNSGSRYIGLVVGRNEGTTTNLYRLNGSTITCNQSYTVYNNQTTVTTLNNLQSATYLNNNLLFDFNDIWLEVPSDYPILKD